MKSEKLYIDHHMSESCDHSYFIFDYKPTKKEVSELASQYDEDEGPGAITIEECQVIRKKKQ